MTRKVALIFVSAVWRNLFGADTRNLPSLPFRQLVGVEVVYVAKRDSERADMRGGQQLRVVLDVECSIRGGS